MLLCEIAAESSVLMLLLHKCLKLHVMKTKRERSLFGVYDGNMQE